MSQPFDVRYTGAARTNIVDRRARFIAMNSWSTDWGDEGYFYMPYAYLGSEQLASDLWTVRTVEA